LNCRLLRLARDLHYHDFKQKMNPIDTIGVSADLSSSEVETLDKLRLELQTGKDTIRALIIASAKWPLSEEVIEDSHYRYILAEEAFDLFSLINRLAGDCKDVISSTHLMDAVFVDEYDLVTSCEYLRIELGGVKYSQYLNYFYGVLLEEILLFATEDEVRKMYTSNGFRNAAQETDIAMIRLYGANERALLNRYCIETGFEPIKDEMDVTQKKEFTYWLFKFRMRWAEPAKAASDVSKALNYMQLARGKSFPSI